jgi:hypothetical protein
MRSDHVEFLKVVVSTAGRHSEQVFANPESTHAHRGPPPPSARSDFNSFPNFPTAFKQRYLVPPVCDW